uniref:Tr-type G domain-containing protein n=2 Tax=Dunaliella tertiolecta TaxID=3047 RepID=A0A7S3QQL7_DUNTE
MESSSSSSSSSSCPKPRALTTAPLRLALVAWGALGQHQALMPLVRVPSPCSHLTRRCSSKASNSSSSSSSAAQQQQQQQQQQTPTRSMQYQQVLYQPHQPLLPPQVIYQHQQHATVASGPPAPPAMMVQSAPPRPAILPPPLPASYPPPLPSSAPPPLPQSGPVSTAMPQWHQMVAPAGSSSSSSSVFWPQSPAAHSQSLWQRPARDAAARLQQTGLKGKQQRQLPENERARRRREEEMLVNIYGRELEVEDSKLQEVQRQRAAKQAAKDLAARTHEDELEEDGAARPPSSQRQGGLFPQHVPRTIEIPAVVSVRQLAELLDCRPAALEAFLAEQLGEPPGSLEDLVAPEAAELAALEWGHVAILQQGTERPLSPRPPVITIMGHVDHGKTSLLDALRNTSVAASEAGGITQHIGAFEVVLPELGNAPLTFLDTPGHSAFSAMRARGAAVTDIVVLVVAADDGIMPQTREALAHASAAGCPIVVALTKCDLQQAKPNAVKQALMVEGLEIEDFGGSVQVVHTSARTGAGLNDLAEALQLQAEMAELQADAEGPAQGVVVEASNSKAGPQVALIVRSGRLRVGDTIVVGTEYGKVRALRGTSRKATAEGVGPGQHALVTGLKGLPQAGDSMTVVADEDRARRISYARSQRAEEYRHLQSMAALHAQRAKESDHMAKLQGMKRELRVQRMALLAQRKQKTAQQLAELSAKHKQAQQEAQAASSAPSPTTAGKLIPRGLTTPTPATEDSDSEQGTEGKEHAQQQPAQQQQQQQQQQPKRPLRLVVKADVQGSMEAVLAMVRELAADRVDLKVLHSGVGQLTPNDVNLALASGAHVVSFNLGPTNAALEKAMSQAGAAGVKFISHNIVYHLMTQIESLIEGTKMHEIVEQVIGEASVQSTFAMSTSGRKKVNLPPGGGRIAGVRVTEGSVQRSAPLVRVIRDGQLIYEGACSSMKRHKQDVDAVGAGTECGIVIDDGRFSDFQPGDTLQFVTSITQKIN